MTADACALSRKIFSTNPALHPEADAVPSGARECDYGQLFKLFREQECLSPQEKLKVLRYSVICVEIPCIKETIESGILYTSEEQILVCILSTKM